MHSVEFLQSQVDYYQKHLLSGNWHDQNLIRALYHRYQSLLREAIGV